MVLNLTKDWWNGVEWYCSRQCNQYQVSLVKLLSPTLLSVEKNVLLMPHKVLSQQPKPVTLLYSIKCPSISILVAFSLLKRDYFRVNKSYGVIEFVLLFLLGGLDSNLEFKPGNSMSMKTVHPTIQSPLHITMLLRKVLESTVAARFELKWGSGPKSQFNSKSEFETYVLLPFTFSSANQTKSNCDWVVWDSMALE